MKIKTNTPVLGINGEKLKEEGGKLRTLRIIVIQSLLASIQGDDEKIKIEKYDLYKKVRDAGEDVDLKSEEIVLIKRAVGKIQPTLLMGQAFEMLEGK